MITRALLLVALEGVLLWDRRARFRPLLDGAVGAGGQGEAA